MKREIFFYPDFRDSGQHNDGKEFDLKGKRLGARVMIYEKTDRYRSGFVMIGAMGINGAIELHHEWLWLTPEQYSLTISKNRR